MSYEHHGSFKFGNTDMYEEFGIMILDAGMPDDLFIPEIRERKVEVPNRHGAYDFGAKYYNERELSLKCIAAESERIGINKENLRQYVREITYVLSKKSEIRLWNEPDKYYIGRLYDAVELTQLRNIGDEFTLTFICEPFAYGKTKTEQMPGLIYTSQYKGTAPTPTYIVIENVGSAAAVNLQIVQTIRRD